MNLAGMLAKAVEATMGADGASREGGHTIRQHTTTLMEGFCLIKAKALLPMMMQMKLNQRVGIADELKLRLRIRRPVHAMCRIPQACG